MIPNGNQHPKACENAATLTGEAIRGLLQQVNSEGPDSGSIALYLPRLNLQLKVEIEKTDLLAEMFSLNEM